ncbi:MAG: hypothetical protein AAF074_06325 [Pseudomonadota bacterium]
MDELADIGVLEVMRRIIGLVILAIMVRALWLRRAIRREAADRLLLPQHAEIYRRRMKLRQLPLAAVERTASGRAFLRLHRQTGWRTVLVLFGCAFGFQVLAIHKEAHP